MKNIAPLLYTLVILFLVISCIQTDDRFTWLLEVFWVIIGLAVLIRLNLKGVSITSILGAGLFLHALILIYGGWYTYERVPLGYWMADWFGFERNHYDRIGHFAQGFIPALLYREVLIRCHVVRSKPWRELIIFAIVMAFSALFELLEFGAAVGFGQDADAFLGSQGDIWDAQWDMFLCGIGGIFSILTLSRWHERQLDRLR